MTPSSQIVSKEANKQLKLTVNITVSESLAHLVYEGANFEGQAVVLGTSGPGGVSGGQRRLLGGQNSLVAALIDSAGNACHSHQENLNTKGFTVMR